MKTTVKIALVAGMTLGSLSVFAGARVNDIATIGGLHVQPGSQKGKIAIIDTQTRIPSATFTNVIAMLKRDTQYNIAYERAEKGEPQTLKEKSGANVAVVILDDEDALSLLVAPEDFWAAMNVAKVARGLDAEKSASRCAKELIRAFSLVCGGGGSTFPGNVMNCAKIEDVDKITVHGLPMDRRNCYVGFLESIGVTPAKLAFYEDACWQGWAPKPKDKYQQAIWDEVHSAPAEPVKIKFDPKQGK